MGASNEAEFSDDATATSSDVEELPTDKEYHQLKRKADRYLLPLMWLCHGLQAVDKASVGTQATFGLREDTGLVGQQFSWLTTAFFITYMCFEIPSLVLLQRYPMGRTLSVYVVCWGIVVLCIGFANNFTQLAALRALQGVFECSVSPGFLLIIGTWYTTREHPSRAIVFQCGFAGVSIITESITYGIGSVSYRIPGFEAWRYMSFFLGGMTIVAGILCFFFLGTPSEVRWLSPQEKKIASTRILANNTGHDQTGVKDWKWEQVKECLEDPIFWITGANSFVGSVPVGALTAFSGILNTSYGFTNLQNVLLNFPEYVYTLLYFTAAGVLATRKKGLRLWIMAFSALPPLTGFLILLILPNEPQYKWVKWSALLMANPSIISTFFAWALVPSNVAGRTKRSVVLATTFVGYCVGNMVGTQIFQAKDAPRYIPGTIGCVVCLVIQVLLTLLWRAILVVRNRNRDKRMSELGISEDDKAKAGLEMGEEDRTDLENPYFRYET